MSGIILLSLPLSLLIFALLALFAVLEVTWRTPSFAGKAGLRSSPPPAAALLAIDMLRTTSYLTGEIFSGETRLKCPETPYIPQVTELETQAIADEISRNGVSEVRRVLQRSRTHDGICPMRLTNGLCACAVVRPLDCLGRCFAGADSPEWANGLGHSVSTVFRQHLERHHANATIRRLDDALLEVLDETPGINATVG